MTRDQARQLFLDHCSVGANSSLERYGEEAAIAAILAAATLPDVASGSVVDADIALLRKMVDDDIAREGRMASTMVRAGLLADVLAALTHRPAAGEGVLAGQFEIAYANSTPAEMWVWCSENYGTIAAALSPSQPPLTLTNCNITTRDGDNWPSDLVCGKPAVIYGYRITPIEDLGNDTASPPIASGYWLDDVLARNAEDVKDLPVSLRDARFSSEQPSASVSEERSEGSGEEQDQDPPFAGPMCPVCGKRSPHNHSILEVEAYHRVVENEARYYGLVTFRTQEISELLRRRANGINDRADNRWHP